MVPSLGGRWTSCVLSFLPFSDFSIAKAAVLGAHGLHDALDDLALALARLALRPLVLLQQAVETVLNLYLGASLNLQTDLVPLAPQLPPQLQYVVLLFDCPFVAPHVRIDHVDPAFTALTGFALAARTHRFIELLSDARPLLGLVATSILGACRLNGLCGHFFGYPFEYLGLTCSPGRLLPLDILDEEPALLTLERGASGHQIGHRLPVRVRKVLHQGVPLVSHIEYYVLQEHRFILFPLGARCYLSVVACCARTVAGSMASLVAHGALRVVPACTVLLGCCALLFLAEHLVILRVDAISLALIDNATLIKQIVAILECNHILLLELPLSRSVLISTIRHRHIILRVGDRLVLPVVLLR